MTRLSELDKLQSIGKDLRVLENAVLSDLGGLNNLTSIGGSLWIITSKLTDVDELAGLHSINGGMTLQNNPVLRDLTGLTNISSIGGDFRILDNALTDFSSFTELESIRGLLQIKGNRYLESLEGLYRLEVSSISMLEISGNPSLSDCAIEIICNFLKIEERAAIISGNGEKCSSLEELSVSCSDMN